MDVKLQWVASGNIDFYTFPARSSALKSDNWRGCRVWGVFPHQCVTHLAIFLTFREWATSKRGYWLNKV